MTSLGGLQLADGGGAGWTWIRPLGGEVGSGVEAAMWELRSFVAVSWAACRSERLYQKKSMLDLRDWRYISLNLTLYTTVNSFSSKKIQSSIFLY